MTTPIRTRIQFQTASAVRAGREVRGEVEFNQGIPRGEISLEWRWKTEDRGQQESGRTGHQPLGPAAGSVLTFSTAAPTSPVSLKLGLLKLVWRLHVCIDGESVAAQVVEVFPQDIPDPLNLAPTFSSGAVQGRQDVWKVSDDAQVPIWLWVQRGGATLFGLLAAVFYLLSLWTAIDLHRWLPMCIVTLLVVIGTLLARFWNGGTPHLEHADISNTPFRPSDPVTVQVNARYAGRGRPALWYALECVVKVHNGGVAGMVVAYRLTRRIRFTERTGDLWTAPRTVRLPEDAPPTWQTEHHSLTWRVRLIANHKTVWQKDVEVSPLPFPIPVHVPKIVPGTRIL